MADDPDDYPCSMRDPLVRQRRQAMLSQPHVAPLTDFANDLRGRLQGEVPDFDPLDGGINARILFLFEKPGPMAAGSGFISRNNDDPTAKATFQFMRDANIPRGDTVIWNVIPWWNGRIKFTGAERQTAIRELDHLRELLPKLDTVVLVGKTAGNARPYLVGGLRVLESAHPSPKVRSTNRTRWDAIPGVWREAATLPHPS